MLVETSGKSRPLVNDARAFVVKSDKKNMSKVIRYNDASASVQSTSDYNETTDMNGASFAERLKSMSTQDTGDVTTQASIKTTISHARLLLQALQTKDQALLESSFREKDINVVRQTIKRLPSRFILLLLESLLERFLQKPGRGRELMPWIVQILALHTAFLLTVPTLVQKLSQLYSALGSRLVTYEKLVSLHGRLNLVLAQMDLQDMALISAQEAQSHELALSYDEEDSDNEDEDNTMTAQIQHQDLDDEVLSETSESAQSLSNDDEASMSEDAESSVNDESDEEEINGSNLNLKKASNVDNAVQALEGSDADESSSDAED